MRGVLAFASTWVPRLGAQLRALVARAALLDGVVQIILPVEGGRTGCRDSTARVAPAGGGARRGGSRCDFSDCAFQPALRGADRAAWATAVPRRRTPFGAVRLCCGRCLDARVRDRDHWQGEGGSHTRRVAYHASRLGRRASPPNRSAAHVSGAGPTAADRTEAPFCPVMPSSGTQASRITLPRKKLCGRAHATTPSSPIPDRKPGRSVLSPSAARRAAVSLRSPQGSSGRFVHLRLQDPSSKCPAVPGVTAMLREGVQLSRISEPEDLVAAVPGVVYRATPLRPGPFEASLTTFGLGAASPCRRGMRALLAFAQAAPGTRRRAAAAGGRRNPRAQRPAVPAADGGALRRRRRAPPGQPAGQPPS